MNLLIFILGTIFGSFLGLVVDRRIKGESIVSPRSHCEACGKTLTALNLVPIFSFTFSKGRCRHCGTRLSLFYPLVEIIAGALLVLNFKLTSSILEFILLSAASFLALVIALIDLRTMEYFSYQVYILLGLGLLYRAVFLGFDKIYGRFFLIFSLVYLILYLGFKDSLGDGDYYYYLGLSLFLRSSSLLYFILISIWLGAIGGIFKAIRHKTTKLRMAFCPYIFLSFIILQIYGVIL
jgi:leader peptidase (prepilin peptidase)/N-methyltransferase